MSTNGKIVIEHIYASQRVFHVSEDFSCEMETLLAREKAREESSGNAEDIGEVIIEFLALDEHTCSIGEQFAAVHGCEISHAPDLVTVNINLAKSDWEPVEGEVLSIIKSHLNWETPEVCREIAITRP